MQELLGYLIAVIVLIIILSVVLTLLKVTVAIMFYVFVAALILSGIAYLYKTFIKR